MTNPGQAVTMKEDGSKGTIERDVGGGDFIVRLNDGRRKAVNKSQFTVDAAPTSADVPSDIVTKDAGAGAGAAIGAGGEEVKPAESVPGGGLTQLDVTDVGGDPAEPDGDADVSLSEP